VHQVKFTIQIKRPISEVFAFVINPENTPKWVNNIAIEETNEWPVRVGTIYRSKSKKGDWAELTLTAFEENKLFSLTKKDGNNHVTYTFSAINPDLTELEYVWVDNGELKESAIQELLDNLKRVMETE
jgi:uncharacterized protein YndB with AHSA1/START domain